MEVVVKYAVNLIDSAVFTIIDRIKFWQDSFKKFDKGFLKSLCNL